MYVGAADLLSAIDWLKRGELDKAFECLKAASEAVPVDPRLAPTLCEFALIACNQACANLQDAEESIRLNELAIAAYALRPDTPNNDYDCSILSMALFNLGATLSRLGREAEAMNCYRDLLALMPEHQAAAQNLAPLLVDANCAAEAVQFLFPIVTKFPENGPLTAQLIRALQEAGRMDEAVAIAKQAASRFPDLLVMYIGYYYRYTKGGVVLTA
jgi:tetratricopeptide (TPR) repeat protein